MQEELDLLSNKYELSRSELVDSQQKYRREIQYELLPFSLLN